MEGDDSDGPESDGPEADGNGNGDGNSDADEMTGIPTTAASESSEAAVQPASESPDPPATRPVAESGPARRLLPLGSGLVLIGLGLGTAFIALRLPRA